MEFILRTLILRLKSFNKILENNNLFNVLYDFIDSLLTEAVNKYINNSEKVVAIIAIIDVTNAPKCKFSNNICCKTIKFVGVIP